MSIFICVCIVIIIMMIIISNKIQFYEIFNFSFAEFNKVNHIFEEKKFIILHS